MKISELPKITSVRPDIEIPLAVQDENYSITLGQIMEALGADSSGGGVVLFGAVRSDTENVHYVDGESPMGIGSVIFDTNTNDFYYGVERMVGGVGNETFVWSYYNQWSTRGDYYDDDAIRKDVLFLSSDGRLYYFNGTTLKSVGITDAQAEQIRHATPIEVSSEEEMERRIAAGEYEEGQIYFTAE